MEDIHKKCREDRMAERDERTNERISSPFAILFLLALAGQRHRRADTGVGCGVWVSATFATQPKPKHTQADWGLEWVCVRTLPVVVLDSS